MHCLRISLLDRIEALPKTIWTHISKLIADTRNVNHVDRSLQGVSGEAIQPRRQPSNSHFHSNEI